MTVNSAKKVNNGKKFHSLSRRIVVQFCMFSIVISLVYGFITFILMYTLEDSFIEKDIHQEARYLITAYEETGSWPATRNDNMELHFSKSTFPIDFREIAIANPMQKEFYGLEGRHYHLYEIKGYPNIYLVAEVSGDLLVRPIREGIITFLLVNGLIVTIVACFIAWLVSRKTTKPLNQLADLVGGAEPEQLPDKFAEQYPNNEVGILATTLEQTLSRISQAMKREKHFTQDVSHELRTPLAVIKNAIELSRTQQSDSKTDQAVLERIYGAADQMEKTVHTLLMLAREENANFENTSTRIMPLIEKSILDNRLLLEGKDIDIDISDDCNVEINADGDMLKVLLDNVLSNAFKYTESGIVAISFQDNKLTIQDSGPGIEPDISDSVTETGVKGKQSTGFGFGLSIVKRLCEHQGWELEVISEQGTKVSVSILS